MIHVQKLVIALKQAYVRMDANDHAANAATAVAHLPAFADQTASGVRSCKEDLDSSYMKDMSSVHAFVRRVVYCSSGLRL